MDIQNMSLVKFIYKLNLANSNTFAAAIDPKTISFFTDGSCVGNGKKNAIGGFSAICVSGYKKNTLVYGKVNNEKSVTNIRAEGYAILAVFELLLSEIECTKWNKCIIYTDSEFWLKMIYNYMPKWSIDTFSTKANPDLTICMWDIWKKINRSDKTIEIIHVYAHNKDNSQNSPDPFKKFSHDNNALADELAGIARELLEYGTVIEVV